MDKRSKEALRRYKKSRQQAQSSSDSSSSSDSDSSESSYSSSDSERHRRKKTRQAAAGSTRRSSSSSAGERRKREKREHCQKKLEAKRMHLKRKLKEAKLKKRAAAAAAALSGHSHRALSPTTQAKLKKLAERKHQRAASKERREREREKHRAAARERDREHHRDSRSPTKITKIRIHQDVKRQKSPPRMHHQLMSREKIIIQTRTRDRTPSIERHRHEHKLRQDELARERERRERERERAEREAARDKERAEREAARDKERAEALARCQERQRERERLAREKLRREEEEKKYGSLGSERGERLLPRPAERDMAIAAARGYNSRERSLEAVERTRHISKRELEVYEREREYLEAERRGLLDREELRREREYLAVRRRELSPVVEHYVARIRDPRDLYAEEERERAYSRAYLDEARIARERDPWPRDLREREPVEIREAHESRDLRDPRDARDFRELEHELIYPDERERLLRNRERVREEWKNDWDVGREHEWAETPPPVLGRGGFIGGPKRGVTATVPLGPSKMPSREQRSPSEPDWDAEEIQKGPSTSGGKIEAANLHDGPGFGAGASKRDIWPEHDPQEVPPHREKAAPASRPEPAERRWQNEWRDDSDSGVSRPGSSNTPSSSSVHHHRSERGGRNFRRGGGAGSLEYGERSTQGGFRPHPPSLMTLPVQPPASGFHSSKPRFLSKRNMTYTNPNLIKKQQAALAAAKAAAQASAVAAASTAVAAAKAAAQSAANATTNPGILGQVSGMRQQQSNVSADAKAEAGEILPENDNGRGKQQSSTKCSAAIVDSITTNTNKVSGELSEISDSDDDILNKTDKKSNSKIDESITESALKPDVTPEKDSGKDDDNDTVPVTATSAAAAEDRPDEDEILDFEEISDGELEEDARNKGVGDALGVDWASLIAETKCQAENAAPSASEEPTTAKQKWQPHRVILDIGISMCMAGEEYAKRLLNESKQKLDEELGQVRNKTEVKDEIVSTADEDSQTNIDTDENTSDVVDKKPKCHIGPQKTLEELDEAAISVERLHPMACIQVAERARHLERRKLIANACGANSRALSARQDLKLRRQLCNFPTEECDFNRPIVVSAKLKRLALAAFQRALEVK